MKFSIEQELDYGKLNKAIKEKMYDFKNPSYLFMNQETLEEFKEKEKLCLMSKNGCNYFEYLCCKIFVDNTFEYGEVEVR